MCSEWMLAFITFVVTNCVWAVIHYTTSVDAKKVRDLEKRVESEKSSSDHWHRCLGEQRQELERQERMANDYRARVSAAMSVLMKPETTDESEAE